MCEKIPWHYHVQGDKILIVINGPTNNSHKRAVKKTNRLELPGFSLQFLNFILKNSAKTCPLPCCLLSTC